jgi:hypothetical protein
MRDYDRNLPLIAMHVPKTAGVSVREIFRAWFGDGLLQHYADGVTGGLPARHDLGALHSHGRPVVVFGHFNRKRGFGIEDYYPEATQFITILRDPFERMVSGYFYSRKHGGGWKDQSRVPTAELREFLLTSDASMLNHFPCEVTAENYKELIETRFVEMGVVEHLDESMERIARKLGKTYVAASLGRLNTTERHLPIPYDLREEFIERRPLDYLVYNYVLAKFRGDGQAQQAPGANADAPT